MYNTTNFYLSVWLMTRGFVATIEYPDNNKNRATFSFKDLPSEKSSKHIQEFYQDEVIQEFVVGIRKLKNLLYSDKEPVVY